MKVKIGIIFFLLLLGQITKANMSSPIWEGTMTSSVISSRDINILSERISIKIDQSFKTAKFIVEYNIQSDLSGRQIPLLFYAKDYKDSFFVWLDDKKISILNVPIKHYENSQFNGFANALQKEIDEDEITIYWEKGLGYVYKLTDLNYFETDIKKGVHKIRVEYIANVWTDISGWIKEFSFRYSLTPAKYWKSFGNLQIIVEQEGQLRELRANLGLPNEKQIKQINSWTFNKLPGEYFEISFSPKPNNIANALMKIEPFGLAVIAIICMAILHFILTKAYRRRNIQNKYSLPVILGSILIPFLSLLAYMYSYDIIDNAIGEDAGRHHGYVFLSIILYPIILVIYWIIFWLIDRIYKRKLLNEKGSR
jgi:hypothetical protein